MDGNGSLFGTISGNTREILGKFSVELPKKHGRGGQSALRFARLRMEKRHNYVRKVWEIQQMTQEIICTQRICSPRAWISLSDPVNVRDGELQIVIQIVQPTD